MGSGRSSNRSRRKLRKSLSSRLLVFRCCSSLSNLNCTICRACTRRCDLACAAAPRSASISLLASAIASTKSRTYCWAFSTLSNGVWRGALTGENTFFDFCPCIGIGIVEVENSSFKANIMFAKVCRFLVSPYSNRITGSRQEHYICLDCLC